jgi:hypothetical protein
MPVRGAIVPIEEDRGDGVVSVGKDVCLNGYAFPEGTLGRKSAAVHPWCDVLDYDTDFAHTGAPLKVLRSGQQLLRRIGAQEPA